MRIILLGAPGSGKGTQGDLITGKYGFPKISSGDLLRQSVRDRTPLGIKAEASMNRGVLVSDDIVVSMIGERIAKPDCREGYILDGFPRTISQALALEEMSPDEAEIILDIDLDDKVVIERLSSRRICVGCNRIFSLQLIFPENEKACMECGGRLIQRMDDRPEVIRKRLNVYHELRDALVAHYKKKSFYLRVNGDAKREDVFAQITLLLDEKIQGGRTKRERE